VAATAEYRLAPDHRFPDALHDAQCALRWLRARRDVDPERVAAGGVSAGAHLALLLGSVDESAGLEDRDCPSPGSSRASAVVSVAGPTDLRLPMDAIRSRVAGFIGPRAERMPEALRLASPVAHLNAGDAPILAFYNRDDRVVPYAQAEVLRDAARRAGVPFTLHTREEGGHAWWGEALMQTVPTITGFLHTTLQ
jgi:acetyl esterase/lipase